MSDVLSSVREARMKLKARGASEHQNAELVEDLFARAQTIIAEMNEAKLAALKETEKPYMKQLEEIDAEMAMLITLAS